MAKFLDATALVGRYGGAIKAKTLANWRSTGFGPAYVKIGGRVLYPIESVEAWEQHQQITPRESRRVSQPFRS